MDLEDQHRFQIWGVWHNDSTAGLLIECTRCDWSWEPDDDEADLAELNQRADEHAEVCR